MIFRLLSKAYLGRIAYIEFPKATFNERIVSHKAVLQRGILNERMLINDRVADDRVTDDGSRSDRDVWADDGVGNLSAVVDVDGWDDDGSVGMPNMTIAMIEQIAIGLEDCFRFPAIFPNIGGCGCEIGSPVDHQLECIGQVKFAFRLNVSFHEFLDRLHEPLGILNIVQSHDRKVRDVAVGFLDQLGDPSVFNKRDAESSRVFYFFHIDHTVFADLVQCAEVGFKNGIDEEDQGGAADVFACEVDGVCLAFEFGLFDKACRLRVVGAYVVFYLVAEVAGDEDEFVDLDCAEGVEDVTKDGFTGYADEWFGLAIGMWAQPGAQTCGWDDDLHWFLLPLLIRFICLLL